MAMILADRCRRAKKRQRQKQQARNLEPQHVQDTADTPQGDTASPVESPYPAVPTGFSAGYA